MAKLSDNFSWHEATHSDTAERKGLSNEPTEAIKENIEITALGMEAIRSLLGNKPIKVTSWYRSPEVNAAVGGSETSDHMTGFAVDFAHSVLNAYTVAKRITDSPLMFDQLIYYPDEHRLHIGFGPRNRRSLMTKRRGFPYEKGINS